MKLTAKILMLVIVLQFFFWPQSNQVQAGYSANLLTNGDFETGDYTGWTPSLTANTIAQGCPDSGVRICIRGSAYQGGNSVFFTYQWGNIYQEVSLTAKGYSTAYLDTSPQVYVSGIVRNYINTPDQYRLKVELRNASHSAIATYDTGTQTAPSVYTEISSTFASSSYGSGLRYIYYQFYGLDAGWGGAYGPIFDDAVAQIEDPIPNYTLSYTAGENGSISGTTPQTVISGGSGSAVTAVPDTGYEFDKWSDNITDNPRTDSNVTADLSVTAEFKAEATSPVFDNLPDSSGPINVLENQTISTNPYLLRVKPTDPSGIKKVDFYVDNNLICSSTIADTNGVYSCSWDTRIYHSIINIIAYDTMDNSASLSRNTVVDPSLYTDVPIPGLVELPETGKL